MSNSSDEKSKTELLFDDITDYYADSVEWCTIDNYEHYLVCGTYQLEEAESKNEGDPQSRTGNITLYKLINIGEKQITLTKLHTLTCSGVLDMKWCPKLLEDSPHLAVACSDGQVLLLKLLVDEKSVCLLSVSNISPAEKEKNLILSLDWFCESDECIKIVASDTSGELNLIKIENSELHLLNRWKAHQFESWICAFDYAQPHLVYSGGDDCYFRGWDVRNLQSSVYKKHIMGVTAISKSKINEYLLASGSYDEDVLLWDTRSMRSPLHRLSVGGGVWRLKWHPHDPEYMLSASMHNGFHVISTSNNQLKVLYHYKKHKSLAYGVDWCAKFHQCEDLCQETTFCRKSMNLIASCSFYDKSLNVWTIKE